MDVLALRVATIPPLAIETVCCSIASCIATLSSGRILSISSMAATPLSAKTNAPASRVIPPAFSRRTAAVNPAAVVPRPEVYKPRGAIFATYCRSCDLAVPGSPNRRTFMSPRMVMSGKRFPTPPKRRYIMASLMCS